MDLEGGCACRALRYRLTADPLIVHACHCRDCQRLTGSAFILNIWIEKKFVEAGPLFRSLSSSLQAAENITRYFSATSAVPTCGANITLRRAIRCSFAWETVDFPEAVKPDVHIFTRRKVPWLDLSKDVPAFESFYNINDVWSVESKERLRRNIAEQARSVGVAFGIRP